MKWTVRFSVTTRRAETAVAVALLLLACAVVWAASLMPSGNVSAPGPGFFPRVLGSLLASVSAGLLIQARRNTTSAENIVELGNPHIALALLALIGLALLLKNAGFVLAATLFILVLLRTLAKLSWMKSTVAAAGTAVLFYYLFVHLLAIDLPAGVLQFP